MSSAGAERQAGISLQTILHASICLALFAFLYAPAYRFMFNSWEAEDYSHCYMVPLIVLYILWEKRSAFRDAAQVPSWFGLLPLGLGVAFYWLGELGGEYYTLYISSWLVMIGMVWTYGGWQKLKSMGFALCFLIAMFPFPNFVTGNLTLRLRLISSQLGVFLLQLSGLSAYREGNVIDLGFTKLQVVDACSGLRFLLPLVSLGVLLAYYYRAVWWKRLLLILSTLPLTVLTNSLRIASVGVLYQFMGPKAAEGLFHDFSGWLMFMVSLALLLAFLWCLKRFFPEPVGGAGAGSGSLPAADGIVRRKVTLGYALLLSLPAVVMLGGTILVAAQVDFREKVPLRKSFADFPVQIGEWQGTRQALEQMSLDQLNLTDYLLVDYKNGSGNRAINFYVAYNDTQSKGKSSHSPASCLPGSGWEFKNSGNTTIEVPSGAAVDVRRAVMEKNGQKRLVYYWFPQRGRVLHNLFELKLYAFWDALTMKRTDGALVRVITPLDRGEGVSDAETRLLSFTGKMVPLLAGYLPGKEPR